LRTFGRAARVNIEQVDVDDVIERSLLLVQEQLRLRGIEVELELCPDELLVVANPIQLEQVFINLLTNARDALADSKHKTIRIADDDAARLDALPEALRLRMNGVQIDTSETATDALERIRETDYDAIVSDIKMPGMDGLALLQEIRELRPATPTLMITGHGERDLAVQALRGGAYDFVQKPIDRDYFIASLERAIQLRRLDREVEQQRLA